MLSLCILSNVHVFTVSPDALQMFDLILHVNFVYVTFCNFHSVLIKKQI